MNILEKTIKSLAKNRIEAIVLDSAEELIVYLNSNIKDSSIVGVGDSMTLESLGVYEYLRNRKLEFLDKYDTKLSKPEKRNIYLRNFDADYFLSSANAITSEGKIFNLDGNGSRVAPIIYGPKQVLIICGTNKIVSNDDEANNRIKKVAAPLDAIRLGKHTPCTIKGECVDCKSTDKICNYLSVIQGLFDENRIKVIFIKQVLGY